VTDECSTNFPKKDKRIKDRLKKRREEEGRGKLLGTPARNGLNFGIYSGGTQNRPKFVPGSERNKPKPMAQARHYIHITTLRQAPEEPGDQDFGKKIKGGKRRLKKKYKNEETSGRDSLLCPLDNKEENRKTVNRVQSLWRTNVASFFCQKNLANRGPMRKGRGQAGADVCTPLKINMSNQVRRNGQEISGGAERKS